MAEAEARLHRTLDEVESTLETFLVASCRLIELAHAVVEQSAAVQAACSGGKESPAETIKVLLRARLVGEKMTATGALMKDYVGG